jgi:hypothetical protein
VVATAEEAGVGLVPSLFWRYETYPNIGGNDEYLTAWGDPSSQTRRFMTNYVHEVVARYNGSPAIWGWEFCNEINLYCDWPNDDWHATVPQENAWAGVGGKITETNLNNKMTYAIAQSAFEGFAQEVRKLDPHRFITTGNGFARPTAYNNTLGTWQADTYSQAREAFGWMAPTGSIDMASFHVYIDQFNDAYVGQTGVADILLQYRDFCNQQGQAMFVGEYSHYWANGGFVPGTPAERVNEEALVRDIVASGTDLAANWVFDYAYGESQGEKGISSSTNAYRWIVDLVVEYDARMRGETPRSPAGVPLDWFDGFGIAPTGSATWAETEIQDLNSNGMPLWKEYYAGIHPVDPDPAFAFTGFQLLENNLPRLSWWGGTNGLTTPYLIQSTTNLANSESWQTLGSKEREQGTNTWTASSSNTAPQRCYRVRATPEQ